MAQNDGISPFFRISSQFSFLLFRKKSILLGGLKANSFLQTLKTDFNKLTFTWRHTDAILKPEVAIFFGFLAFFHSLGYFT